jgi:MFS family permease
MTSVIAEDTGLPVVPDRTSNLLTEEPADGSAESEKRSSWRVLRQRDFRLYFIGSLVSNLGTWLQSTAQVLIAYRVTHSVFMVGLIASAQFAWMVVSPWAPVLADRFSPRAVLVGTQCFSALIAVVMALRYHYGLLGIHSLLVGAFALGFAYALALPVQTALIPALVREEDAADAVKLNSVSYNAGRALAPALCVPVIIFIGPDLLFFLNALSFVIFAILLRRLKPIAGDTSLRRTFAGVLRASLNRTMNPIHETFARASALRPRARVRDGLLAALERRRLLLLLAIVAAVTLADDPILVLSPAVATRLHMPRTSVAYLIAALGWGSVLGSLVPAMSRDNDTQRASKRAAVWLLVLSVSVLVFTAGTWFPLNIAGAAVAGAAALFTGTAAQTALLRHHKKTGADVASVAALWAIAWAGTKPFASLLDGWLASRHGIVFTGVVLVAPAITIALCELFLPHEAKRRINNGGDWMVSGIVRRSIRAAPIDSEPESQPQPDEMTLKDATPTAA